ncbi:phage tail tube protein [Phenylobacterium terrae]|uniref:phage tail tube protein n=1 Tax=Phenylobacterium terrae TaxID=2665495 RepID=UPI00366CD103
MKIGDGAATEVFAHPNAINLSRGITFNVNADPVELTNLSDQTLPAQTTRKARSFDSNIEGTGRLDSTDVEDWLDWSLSGAKKNIRFEVGGRMITGPYILTSFSITGEAGDYAECSVSLAQAGPITHAAVS